MIPIGAGGAMGSAADRYTYFGQYEGGIFQLASGFGWFLHDGGKRPGSNSSRKSTSRRRSGVCPRGSWCAAIARIDRLRRFHRASSHRSVLAQPGLRRRRGSLRDAGVGVQHLAGSDRRRDLELAAVMKRNAVTEAARDHYHVVIGPGNHCQYFGPKRNNEVGELARAECARTADRVAGRVVRPLAQGQGGVARLPPYRYYVMGEDRWMDSDQWPPREVQVSAWYLRGEGVANSCAGSRTLVRRSAARRTERRVRLRPAASGADTRRAHLLHQRSQPGAGRR